MELLGIDDYIEQPKRPGTRGTNRQIVEEDSINDFEDYDDTANQFSMGFVNNVLSNFEGFQEKKKRMRLPPARMRQLPKFEIADLIGNFDIDEDGNYIIISNGKDNRGYDVLEDKQGRRVNKRGYLLNNQL